jgi:uncharacterized delta-60 repeat protein
MNLWKLRTAKIVAAISVIAFAGPITQAQAVDTSIFDTSFGTDGIATISIPKQVSTTEIIDVLIDASQNTIALVNINTVNGEFEIGEPKVAIARYLLDGQRDQTFGDGSGSTTPLALWQASIALQSDGKILLVGLDRSSTNTALVVRRYLPTGKIDTSFATNGTYRLASLPNRSFKNRALVTVNPAGRIILATEITNGNTSSTNFYFVGLTKFGTEDYEFGGGGNFVNEFVFQPGMNTYPELFAVRYLTTGGILALGMTGAWEMILLKFNAQGILDTSFGGVNNVGGMVTVSFPNQAYTRITTMKELPNGHIAFAGAVKATSNYSEDWFYAMALFDENGVPNTSFNETGFLATNIVATSQRDVHGIVKRESGNFHFPVGSTGAVSLMTVNPTNAIASWSVVTYAAAGKANSIALQNNKLVIGGLLDNTNPASVLMRARDTAASDFLTQQDQYRELDMGLEIRELLPLSDGKILGFGTTEASIFGNNQIVLFRLNSSGALDRTFGTNGVTLVSNGEFIALDATGIAIRTDQKIVVLSEARHADGRNVVLLRFTADGTLDSTFGSLGITSYDSGESDYPTSLVIDSEQRILVANNRCCDAPRAAIVRFTPNGQLDTGFDGATALATLGDSNNVSQMKLDANQKIVLVGSAVTSGSLALVARLLPNGQLDSGFSEDGFTLVDLDDVGTASKYSYLEDFVITDTGKIAAIGGGNTPDKLEAVVFFKNNGNLDVNGTNQTGITRFASATGVDYAELNSIAQDGDGFLVVGGGSVDESIWDSIFATVVRFGSNGLLDSDFDNGGIHLPDLNGGAAFSTVTPVSLQQFLVGGFVFKDGMQRGVVMRIGAPAPTVPVTTVPATTVPVTTVPVTTVPATTVPVTTVPVTTVPVTTVPAITVPATTVPVVAAAVAPKIAQDATLSAESAPVKLVIAVSQATILKNLKLTVPKGGVATFSIAKSSAKVCKVVKKQVLGTAIGTCRVSVTIKTKSKKSVTKSMAFKVSG